MNMWGATGKSHWSRTNSKNLLASQANAQIACVTVLYQLHTEKLYHLKWSKNKFQEYFCPHTRGWSWQFKSGHNSRYSERALLCLWLSDTRPSDLNAAADEHMFCGKKCTFSYSQLLVCGMEVFVTFFFFLHLCSPSRGGEWQALLLSRRGREPLSLLF